MSVLDVRRAFDALAADRLRGAAGTRAAAEVHATGAAAIQDLLLPGDTGVDAALRGFFDAMETLAVDAAAVSARQAVLGAGRTLAEALSSVGAGLEGLRDDLSARASGAVTARRACWGNWPRWHSGWADCRPWAATPVRHIRWPTAATPC